MNDQSEKENRPKPDRRQESPPTTEELRTILSVLKDDPSLSPERVEAMRKRLMKRLDDELNL